MLTIGEFSQLGRISPRMLRHYDELNLLLAYGAVCTWLAQHPEYRVIAPAMDRYLNDPHQIPPEQLETSILFPVEKAE